GGTSGPVTREARGRRPTLAVRSSTKLAPVEISTVPSGGRATVRVPPCRGRRQTRHSARSGEFACPSVQTRPGRVTTPLPAWPGPRTGRCVCGAGPAVCRAGPAPGGAAGDAGGGPCQGVGVGAAGGGGGGGAGTGCGGPFGHVHLRVGGAGFLGSGGPAGGGVSDLGRCATDPGHPVDEVVADGGGGLGRGDRRCLHRGSGRRPGRVRLVRWGRRLG